MLYRKRIKQISGFLLKMSTNIFFVESGLKLFKIIIISFQDDAFIVWISHKLKLMSKCCCSMKGLRILRRQLSCLQRYEWGNRWRECYCLLRIFLEFRLRRQSPNKMRQQCLNLMLKLPGLTHLSYEISRIFYCPTYWPSLNQSGLTIPHPWEASQQKQHFCFSGNTMYLLSLATKCWHLVVTLGKILLHVGSYLPVTLSALCLLLRASKNIWPLKV